MRFMDGDVYHIRHDNFITDSIKIPLVHDERKLEIGTKKVVYDSLHNKLYLNNENAIFQFDFSSRQMKPLTSEKMFGKIETGREIIDYALDAEGRVWIWLPSYGIRIIDPLSLILYRLDTHWQKGIIIR